MWPEPWPSRLPLSVLLPQAYSGRSSGWSSLYPSLERDLSPPPKHASCDLRRSAAHPEPQSDGRTAAGRAQASSQYSQCATQSTRGSHFVIFYVDEADSKTNLWIEVGKIRPVRRTPAAQIPARGGPPGENSRMESDHARTLATSTAHRNSQNRMCTPIHQDAVQHMMIASGRPWGILRKP